eukprot:32018-Eustigmatos_ZCMA.PRE.1
MKAREAKAAEVRAHGPEGLREVLQEVEDDLQSALPPLRARGISTLTKVTALVSCYMTNLGWVRVAISW